MKINDLIRMGLNNLSRRKARTALTIVGVIIGTISIVVMISIGIGMNASYKAQVMERGSLTTITIQKYGAIYDDKGNPIDYKEQKMDDSLLHKIQSMEHVKVATPVISKSIMITSGKYQTNMQLRVMDYSTFEEFGFPALVYGEYPSEGNEDIIVVGSYVPQYFYNPYSMRGQSKTVDFAKDRFKISFNDWEYQPQEGKRAKEIPWENSKFAVMEQSNSNEGYDYSCYMDINVFKKYYKDYIKILKAEDKRRAERSLTNYEQIKINVDNLKNVEEVQSAITDLGFSSESLAMELNAMIQTSSMLQMVLGGVGAVAMLVSAISIANTMVMSIYERTKEIGVMKVLGCIITDIKKLFLFEAGMIGLIGGIIGIIISYIASFCINKFGAPVFEALMQSGGNMAGGETVATKFSIIPLWLPLLAAAFAMLIGILSGYYPANRATKISAIEAMKSDG